MGLVQGVESTANEDLDSSDESLRERVLKIVQHPGVPKLFTMLLDKFHIRL